MSTWVLLRGLTREAAHWGRLQERLAVRLGAPHRVVALDLPGNGSRHRETSPVTVAQMALACQQELLQRSLQPPFVLVAMSLGAMVAWHWAHAMPASLAGCVLINTSLGGVSPFWERLQPRNYLRLLQLAWPAGSLLQREAAVLALTSSAPQRHAGVPAAWAQIAQQHPVTRANALRQLLAAARYMPPPGPPTVPALVLASAGDRLVSPRCSQRLARRCKLPLQLHPDAGHDLPLDDPAWVMDQMAGWWSALAAGRRS